jgi:hypothetical protein
MSRRKAERVVGGTDLSISHIAAFGALALCTASILPAVAHAAGPGIVLWNKLGSTSEVLNSDYGPNLGFFNTPGSIDIVGNPAYVPGEFGNGLSIGPGSYFSAAREHTVVWSGVDQYLNPDRGTISVWYKQNSNPVNFDHGVYRLFDGPYGLSTGIGLWTQSSFPSPGPPTLNFGMDFGGTGAGVSYDSSSLNGPWIHVAGVWDRNGIDNTTDTLRLYINGNVVASTTSAGWGTTVGQFADIAGGNDQNIAGQFAIDNLKVYNVAITDFSDRFTEGIPEPASACLMLAGAALLGSFRPTRRAPPAN